MKISVIVPSYNSAETIQRCLTAICQQEGYTFNSDYEVIVVDDGSTDESATLIESSEYDVTLIRLRSNQGRIVARKTGAEAARADTLLFIDTRVIASNHLLKSYEELNISCCYAGELGEAKNAQKNPVDRLFYAMRQKYYHPYYPQQEENVELTAANFSKLPKGAAGFFCPKDIYLNSIPPNSGKNVNDDARLLANILFEQNTPIFRSTKLQLEYLQRDINQISTWLIERGILFTDFVFKKKLLYQLAFVLSWVFIGSMIITAIVSPPYAGAIIGSGALLYGAIVVWLGNNIQDRIFFARYLIVVVFYFWWGVNKGLWQNFNK